MKVKTALAALALTVIPAMSFAMCGGHEQQAQSCSDGTVWDSESRTCVNQVTG